MSLDQHHELKQRTKAFALRIIRLTKALPPGREADIIGRQVLRSATSIAANYRAAGRGRSKAEFTAKLGIVIEEADETVLWLELLGESGIIEPSRLRDFTGRSKPTVGGLCSILANTQAVARNLTR